MRPALVTLVPMLAAAAFALIGGERLAREEIAERIPADRERLLTFADSLERELDRLDLLYLSHLERLAAAYGPEPTQDFDQEARGIKSLRAIHYRTVREKSGELVLTSVRSRERLPEIVLEKQDRPLNPKNAVILPSAILETEQTGARGWSLAPDPKHRIFWIRPDHERLVVFVISWLDLHDQLRTHLQSWMGAPLIPIQEAGERMALHGPCGEQLALTGDQNRGPAALLMPLRTGLGDWQLQAWDGVSLTTRHDPVTLGVAGTLAAVLILGGLFLFVQQRRALQLAEERVSFVNRVSHELGTPLTNVALNLDLATEAVDTSPPEALRRLGVVTEEVERLARLVANVLTFSRKERQTLEIDPQPCTPDEVIGKTLDSFRPALRRREIEVDWKAGAAERVHLDPDALGQIVGNLISNVEKYGATGHWLGIRSELESDYLVVTVADRGPGIPTANRERIFQAFERVHRKVNEGSSGTGLGLTIARELASRMGGALVLLEREPETCFELRLPAPPGPEDRLQRPKFRGMTILIAEDDPVTLEAIASCVEADGFATLRAANGREALKLWNSKQPHLLCLDIMMPEVDGFEVCRQVRSQNKEVPILFLSAKNEERDVVTGLDLGADDFIRKPFTRREVMARIRAALRRANSRQDPQEFRLRELTVRSAMLLAERDGQQIDLTPREVSILKLLHAERGKAVSRDRLLDECWGLDYFPDSRTLDQHILMLRKKIERDPAHPEIIETVRGVGYRFRAK